MTPEEARASLARSEAKFKGNRHSRKAYAALGDDVTLSRFVKKKNTGVTHRKYKQLGLGNFRSKAFEEGRSVFSRRGVKDPANVSNVLVSGHSNIKIGRDVRKGRLFRGYWIYTLTLEERATCPTTCFHWTTCYGNNMPYAKRIRHGGALIKALQAEIPKLLDIRGRAGLLLRLHALGDFYSVAYVKFWASMLRKYPRIAIFGYTAREPNEAIGQEIQWTKNEFGRRFSIRWSRKLAKKDGAIPIFKESDCPSTAIACPEQSGKTQCCATCGLCWNSDKNIAFVEH